MKKTEVIKFLIVRTIGNFLFLFMIFGFGATFGPTVYYEVDYRVANVKGITYKIIDEANNPLIKRIKEEQKIPSLLGKITTSEKEQYLVPKSTDFGLIIPKIGANEKVLENVDTTDSNAYLEALKSGVAHARGTAFPGMNGSTYIFAHSTDNFWNVSRYNAVFFLLKELEVEDDVVVFFMNKRHNYKVTEKIITDADDTSYLNSNIGKGEELILQTCWPPGTTWKRLLIVAMPKEY